jgi:hypothetical protein
MTAVSIDASGTMSAANAFASMVQGSGNAVPTGASDGAASATPVPETKFSKLLAAALSAPGEGKDGAKADEPNREQSASAVPAAAALVPGVVVPVMNQIVPASPEVAGGPAKDAAAGVKAAIAPLPGAAAVPSGQGRVEPAVGVPVSKNAGVPVPVPNLVAMPKLEHGAHAEQGGKETPVGADQVEPESVPVPDIKTTVGKAAAKGGLPGILAVAQKQGTNPPPEAKGPQQTEPASVPEPAQSNGPTAAATSKAAAGAMAALLTAAGFAPKEGAAPEKGKGTTSPSKAATPSAAAARATAEEPTVGAVPDRETTADSPITSADEGSSKTSAAVLPGAAAVVATGSGGASARKASDRVAAVRSRAERITMPEEAMAANRETTNAPVAREVLGGVKAADGKDQASSSGTSGSAALPGFVNPAPGAGASVSMSASMSAGMHAGMVAGQLAPSGAKSAPDNLPATRSTQAALDAPLSAASSGARDVVMPDVAAVRMVQGVTGEEMHLGLRSAAFGRIEVHTVVHDAQVGVQVGSERGDLGRWLAPEIPALGASLKEHDLRLDQIRVLDTPAGAGGGFNAPHGGAQDGQHERQGWTRSALHVTEMEPMSKQETFTSSGDASVLSILV